MRAVIVGAVGLVLSHALFLEPVMAAGCAPDSVQSGTVCMDKYESSVWYVPPSERGLISKIRDGRASLANLTSASALGAGVVQLGLAAGDLAAHGCPATGNGCVDFPPPGLRERFPPPPRWVGPTRAAVGLRLPPS